MLCLALICPSNKQQTNKQAKQTCPPRLDLQTTSQCLSETPAAHGWTRRQQKAKRWGNSDVQGQAFPREKAQMKPRLQGNVGPRTQRASHTIMQPLGHCPRWKPENKGKTLRKTQNPVWRSGLCKGSCERAYYGSTALEFWGNQKHWPFSWPIGL